MDTKDAITSSDGLSSSYLRSGDLVSFALHPISHTIAPLQRLSSVSPTTSNGHTASHTPHHVHGRQSSMSTLRSVTIDGNGNGNGSSAMTPRWTRSSTSSFTSSLPHSGFFLASDAVIKTSGGDSHSLIAFKLGNHELAREYIEGCIFKLVTDKVGSVLKYGDQIQLQHVHTMKFVTWRESLSKTDSSSLRVALHSSSLSHSVFTIVPRYTFRSEGDKVCDDDPLLLLAADSGYGEQYLHASKDGEAYEVNLSKHSCVWRPHLFRSFEIDNLKSVLKGGDVVRLYHKERLGSITVHTLGSPFDSSVSYQLMVKQSNTAFSSKGDSWSLWILEMDCPEVGAAFTWRSYIRLKNIATGQYLCALSPSSISASSSSSSSSSALPSPLPMTAAAAAFKMESVRWSTTPHADDSTLFVFHSTSASRGHLKAMATDPNAPILFSSWTRIQNVCSGAWLSTADTPASSSRRPSSDDITQPSSWPLCASSTIYEDDAFEITRVSREELEDFFHVWTRKPLLFDFARRLWHNDVTDRSMELACGVLVDFGRYCTKSETPDIETRRGHALPAHQAMIRDQRIVECVVDICDAAYHMWTSAQQPKPPIAITSSSAASDEKESKSSSRDSFLRPLGGVPLSSAPVDPEVEKRKKQVLAIIGKCLPLAYSFLRLFAWQNVKEQNYLANVDTKDFSNDSKEVVPFIIAIRKHLHLPNGIGKLALEAIKSVYKNNARLLSAISHDDIKVFFYVPKQLQEKLPDFLSVFCAANNDEGITSNQAAVLRLILDADFVAEAQGTPRSPLAAAAATAAAADSDELPNGAASSPLLQSAMSTVLAVPVTRMVTPFIPKFRLDSDRVMIDVHQDGTWQDFEEWFPPPGLLIRGGGGDSRERTRDKDHIRASLWLLRSLCLGNSQAVAKFQVLYPRALLLALVTNKRIPSRFKRNVAELLNLLWVTPLEMESRHLPHQSFIRIGNPKIVEEEDKIELKIEIKEGAFRKFLTKSAKTIKLGVGGALASLKSPHHASSPSSLTTPSHGHGGHGHGFDDFKRATSVRPAFERQASMVPPTPTHLLDTHAREDYAVMKEFVISYISQADVINPQIWNESDHKYHDEHWEIVLAVTIFTLLRRMIVNDIFTDDELPHIIHLLTRVLKNTEPVHVRQWTKSERNGYLMNAKTEICLIYEHVFKRLLDSCVTNLLLERDSMQGAKPATQHQKRAWDTTLHKRFEGVLAQLIKDACLTKDTTMMSVRGHDHHLVFTREVSSCFLAMMLYEDAHLRAASARVLVLLHTPADRLLGLLTTGVLLPKVHQDYYDKLTLLILECRRLSSRFGVYDINWQKVHFTIDSIINACRQQGKRVEQLQLVLRNLEVHRLLRQILTSLLTYIRLIKADGTVSLTSSAEAIARSPLKPKRLVDADTTETLYTSCYELLLCFLKDNATNRTLVSSSIWIDLHIEYLMVATKRRARNGALCIAQSLLQLIRRNADACQLFHRDHIQKLVRVFSALDQHVIFLHIFQILIRPSLLQPPSRPMQNDIFELLTAEVDIKQIVGQVVKTYASSAVPTVIYDTSTSSSASSSFSSSSSALPTISATPKRSSLVPPSMISSTAVANSDADTKSVATSSTPLPITMPSLPIVSDSIAPPSSPVAGTPAVANNTTSSPLPLPSLPSVDLQIAVPSPVTHPMVDTNIPASPSNDALSLLSSAHVPHDDSVPLLTVNVSTENGSSSSSASATTTSDELVMSPGDHVLPSVNVHRPPSPLPPPPVPPVAPPPAGTPSGGTSQQPSFGRPPSSQLSLTSTNHGVTLSSITINGSAPSTIHSLPSPSLTGSTRAGTFMSAFAPLVTAAASNGTPIDTIALPPQMEASLSLWRGDTNRAANSSQVMMLHILSLCAQGRNCLVEVKCQSVLSIEGILQILLRDASHVPYDVKIPFLRFLHEVHIYTAPDSDQYPLQDKYAALLLELLQQLAADVKSLLHYALFSTYKWAARKAAVSAGNASSSQFASTGHLSPPVERHVSFIFDHASAFLTDLYDLIWADYDRSIDTPQSGSSHHRRALFGSKDHQRSLRLVTLKLFFAFEQVLHCNMIDDFLYYSSDDGCDAMTTFRHRSSNVLDCMATLAKRLRPVVRDNGATVELSVVDPTGQRMSQARAAVNSSRKGYYFANKWLAQHGFGDNRIVPSRFTLWGGLGGNFRAFRASVSRYQKDSYDFLSQMIKRHLVTIVDGERSNDINRTTGDTSASDTSICSCSCWPSSASCCTCVSTIDTRDDEDKDALELASLNPSAPTARRGSMLLLSAAKNEPDSSLLRSRLLFRRLSRFLCTKWVKDVSDSASSNDDTRITLITTICRLVQQMEIEESGRFQMLQYAMSRQGFARLVIHLVVHASHRIDVINRALKLGNLLLKGGNPKVQAIFMRFFRRPLGKDFLRQLRHRIRTFKEDVKLQSEETVKWTLRHRDDHIESISHILQFLQLCCEGHNSAMQNYLRNQDDTDRPVNLVAEVLDLYRGYSKELIASLNEPRKTLWPSGVQLGIGILRSLTEYVQGPCKENQLALAAFKEGYETNNQLLSAINDRLVHQTNDPYCSACSTPIRHTHTSNGVNMDTKGTSVSSSATSSSPLRAPSSTSPTLASGGSGSDASSFPPVKDGTEHTTGTNVNGANSVADDAIVVYQDRSVAATATCENGHPICSSQICRGRTTRRGWSCAFCDVLILEKSILQYASGLLEGNDMIQTYGNQINALHVPVFFKMLQFHCEEKPAEPLGRLDRLLASASTLAPWVRSAAGLADSHSETALLIFAFLTRLRDHPLVSKNHNASRNAKQLQDRLAAWKKQHIEKSRIFLQVEVLNQERQLEKVFFQIPPVFHVQPNWIKTLKREIMEGCCALSSSDERLKRFMTQADDLVDAVQHEHRLGHVSHCQWLVNIIRNRGWWRPAYFFAAFANILLIAYAKNPDSLGTTTFERSDASDVEAYVNIWMYVISALHLICSVLMVVEYFMSQGYLEVTQHSVQSKTEISIVPPRGWRLSQSDYVAQQEKEREKFARCRTIGKVATLPSVMYYTIYLILAILALAWSPYFNAFHLVDVVIHSRHLRFIIDATTSRARQIFATICLGLVTVYLFSVVGFVFFQGKYGQYIFDSDNDQAFACNTLANCLQKHFDLGWNNQPIWVEGQAIPVITPLYDFCYTMLVNVILVSLITGIIIDTFGEMRGQRDEIEEEMHNNCFICCIDRETFNLHGDSFKHHVTVEHNMWAYVYLKHYLKLKMINEPTELTGQESYLHECFETHTTRFFPVRRALVLPSSVIDSHQRRTATHNNKDTNSHNSYDTDSTR